VRGLPPFGQLLPGSYMKVTDVQQILGSYPHGIHRNVMEIGACFGPKLPSARFNHDEDKTVLVDRNSLSSKNAVAFSASSGKERNLHL
jgi:hypothetical protein